MRKSKRLSYLLRHDNDYPYETGGWRQLSDLCQNHSFSLEEIIEIVSNDDKGRFELNLVKRKIRALYGHSVKIDLQLKREEPPIHLLHGTASKYIESILQNGLNPRSRQFVHLTDNRELAIKTGLRHGEPVLLMIDSQAMSNDGYVFFRVCDGFWLTKKIPVKYLQLY